MQQLRGHRFICPCRECICSTIFCSALKFLLLSHPLLKLWSSAVHWIWTSSRFSSWSALPHIMVKSFMSLRACRRESMVSAVIWIITPSKQKQTGPCHDCCWNSVKMHNWNDASSSSSEWAKKATSRRLSTLLLQFVDAVFQTRPFILMYFVAKLFSREILLKLHSSESRLFCCLCFFTVGGEVSAVFYLVCLYQTVKH